MSERNDDIGRHIGTLFKTAVAGWDTMREVVVRSTQTGRIRVDIALLARERAQLLQTLGETIIGLFDDGTWSMDDAPESVRQALERVKDVEGQLKSDRIKVSDNAFGAPRGFEPEAASDYGQDDTQPGLGDADAGEDLADGDYGEAGLGRVGGRGPASRPSGQSAGRNSGSPRSSAPKSTRKAGGASAASSAGRGKAGAGSGAGSASSGRKSAVGAAKRRPTGEKNTRR